MTQNHQNLGAPYSQGWKSLVYTNLEETHKQRESRNFGLDLVRASAITMVVVSHLLRPLEKLGIYGVELFFVLSGFLIGGILVRSLLRPEGFRSGDLVRFWIRRWFRTIPNYYLFLLLYLAATRTSATTKQLWSYAVFFQNLAWRIFPFAVHTWSLTIEEWFYLLFPAALLLAARKTSEPESRLRRFLYVTAIFILLPTVLRFTQSYWLGYSDARAIVISRLDAIMYGVFLAYLRAGSSRWSQLRGFWPVGLLGIAASTLLLRSHSIVAQAAAFTVIPPGFAIILPAFERWSKASGRVAGFIEHISIWSYSMYLCHMLIYMTTMQVTGYPHRSSAVKIALKCFVVLLTVGISALNYRLFERPMTDLRERLAGPTRRTERGLGRHMEISPSGS